MVLRCVLKLHEKVPTHNGIGRRGQETVRLLHPNFRRATAVSGFPFPYDGQNPQLSTHVPAVGGTIDKDYDVSEEES
jgi:hypothetical protein